MRHAAQHDVTVYGSRLVCESGTYRGLKVRAFPTGRWKHAGPVALQLQCALHAALLGDFDVVHLHGQENAFVLPLLLPRYPVVSTHHSPPYLRDKWSPAAKVAMRSVEGWSVRLPMVATAVASTQAAQLSERHRVEVLHVPNGVDVDEVVDEESARSLLVNLDLKPQGYWMFAAARIDPTKGAQDLIRACRELRMHPPVLLVGDLHHAPGFEDELRGLAEGMDVRIVPRLDDKATLLGLVKLAGLFVFPSRLEGMSMMLLEALCVGTPTLASDIPENLAVLAEDASTFRAGDVGDLATRLKAVSAMSPRARRERSVALRCWVQENYAWDGISRRYEALYEVAIERRKARQDRRSA
ncbi:MAG TPA: glycosyltransferase family 4 protein [Thermoleophilia bacterium]|nr:glycosyltransferase family 4 protein [Thermoleophilia bacterium]